MYPIQVGVLEDAGAVAADLTQAVNRLLTDDGGKEERQPAVIEVPIEGVAA